MPVPFRPSRPSSAKFATIVACTNSGVMERALGWSQFIPIRVLEIAGGSIPSNWYDTLNQRRKGGSELLRVLA